MRVIIVETGIIKTLILEANTCDPATPTLEKIVETYKKARREILHIGDEDK